MNKWISIVLFSFIITLPLSGQTSRETAAMEIETIMQQQVNSWNSASVEAYMQAYWKSDQLTFVGGSGMIQGWETTLERYLKAYPDSQSMGKLSFQNKKIDLLSDSSALVSGRWRLDRSEDTLKGWYTLIWKKQAQSWKIVYDHSSSE